MAVPWVGYITLRSHDRKQRSSLTEMYWWRCITCKCGAVPHIEGMVKFSIYSSLIASLNRCIVEDARTAMQEKPLPRGFEDVKTPLLKPFPFSVIPSSLDASPLHIGGLGSVVRTWSLGLVYLLGEGVSGRTVNTKLGLKGVPTRIRKKA